MSGSIACPNCLEEIKLSQKVCHHCMREVVYPTSSNFVGEISFWLSLLLLYGMCYFLDKILT